MLALKEEEHISAPIQQVWNALFDLETLKTCIPGCENLESSSPTNFHATVALKIGPMKARFGGDVAISNLNPPYSATIGGEGKAGVIGFARGSANVSLRENGANSTILSYETSVVVGGKIAQLGGRLIESTSRKLSAQFFSKFNDRVAGSE